MPSPIDPQQLKAHQEWLGYLQPVGLVVAPAAMVEAGWVLTQSGKELLARQERYREALEPLHPGELAAEVGAHGAAGGVASPAGRLAEGGGDAAANPEASGDLDDDQDDSAGLGFRSLTELLVQHLGWREEQLDRRAETISGYRRELPELGTTLAPTAVVPAVTGSGASDSEASGMRAQLLVMELPMGTELDRKGSDGEQVWRATAQERLERLLRETGVEAGLLFNGRQLRLVVAPKGESSGHLTFPLADLAAVGGRLMFSGLDQLLRVSHVFDDPDGKRLGDVLKKSRSFQAVVSNALADQVLAALWELLRGFQQADALSRRTGDGEAQKALLGDLPETEPQQLYGGLITVLMRLVFLLYAEDEALMPADAVYEQNYKVSGLFERLQQEAAELPDTMEQRYGAWSGLISLCKLVFDGGGPTRDYLPARHGQLFDPSVYPWLATPWISDGVVLAVLRNLLIVKGERISYRALDVEQIGSVYEGIMGYAVRRIPGRCIGIKSKPQGARKQLTTAVDLDVLLAKSGPQRKAWLEQEANTALPANAAKALASASTEADLLAALAPRLNRELFDGPQPAGSLVFQPTEERRRSGSHYTPRSLTRPIVEEALRPWLERCEHKPKAAQILDLKICDPAMGSGAFLVESCRYLAELLEQAWTREGLPQALQPGGHAHGEEPLLYARRLIAQSCLYGVDKNPFAVNLARLSLWLVSLSKDAPFTFVDHALKCGDSLVGVTKKEIEAALKGASKQRDLWEEKLRSLGQQQSELMHLFHADSRSDADDDRKRQALEDLESSTAYLRTVGDLLVAAYFNGRSSNERNSKKDIYMAATIDCSTDAELQEVMAEPLEDLRDGEQGIKPLHWELTFPSVFQAGNPGFDAFVGNPPYLGGRLIARSLGDEYTPALKEFLAVRRSSADLVVYFVARCSGVVCAGGSVALITTKSIKEGDTRPIFQDIIEKNKHDIYYATTPRLWPGVAGTSFVSFAMTKDAGVKTKRLDGVLVDRISSALAAEEADPNPFRLTSKYNASRGVTLMGDGFIVTESEEEELVKNDSRSAEVIKRYVGADDMLNIVRPVFPRGCIDFGDMSESIASGYKSVFNRVYLLVKPVRDRLTKQIHETCFWKHWDKRLDFFARLREEGAGIIIPRVAKYMLLDRHAAVSGNLYSDSVNIVASADWGLYATLQSRVHETWVNKFKSSRDARIIYNVKSCFRTFPCPRSMGSIPGNATVLTASDSLENCPASYHQFRAELMVANNEGLTKTYNRFHDPEETSEGILELRRLHSDMDQAVLNAYGWSDVPTACGYGLDYLDTADDAELPEHLQDRIDSGDLFFWKADEAAAFRAELIAYGAVKASKKLPWRYRWPDDVRDDVLARLLALNAERYAEEVAQGLHGNVQGSPAATPTPAPAAPPAAAPRGRRRRSNPDQTDLLGSGAG